jgi:D-arabinose 1-dehydrogenase-like Zn-dependent alcohol dehydrogenase
MASFQPPATMRAVVYKGPHEVAVEDKPYPKLLTDTDCILKVTTSALCGSDLHFYRGHLDVPAGFTCGHEFVGEIVEKGSAVKNFSYGEKVSLHLVIWFDLCMNGGVLDHNRALQDDPWSPSSMPGKRRSPLTLHHQVVVPFYTACGQCFYCVRGQASRCAEGQLFGNALSADSIDGGQAEYVRTSLRYHLRASTHNDPRGNARLDGRHLPYRILRSKQVSQEPERSRPQRIHYCRGRLRSCWSLCHCLRHYYG